MSLFRNDCFPEVPPDGLCLAGPEDTVQNITDLEQVTFCFYQLLTQ